MNLKDISLEENKLEENKLEENKFKKISLRNISLEDIRDEIDILDKQIAELISKRMQLCENVADYKKANNLPVYHPEREAAVIKKVSALTEAKYVNAISEIYKCMMLESKKIQSDKICK